MTNKPKTKRAARVPQNDPKLTDARVKTRGTKGGGATESAGEPQSAAGVRCSALLGNGILTYDLSPSEKLEVQEFIQQVHPLSLNSTIVLDSGDLPPDLNNLVSFASRDKDVIQCESRQLLSHAREYKLGN